MTKAYFGTKRIIATAMTRAEYIAYRGWTLPQNEDGSDAGYLVEYVNGGPANHPGHEGYISWSPKAVFDLSYQPVTAMSFGHALACLKSGGRVARAGWNGKNMWIALTPGSEFASRHAKPGHAAWHRANELDEVTPPDGGENTIRLLPHIDLRTAGGALCVGWLASQEDILSEDWVELTYHE